MFHQIRQSIVDSEECYCPFGTSAIEKTEN